MGYTKNTRSAERNTSVRRVLWSVLVLNVAVAAAKLLYGTITGSVAMVADGFHSLFDGTSNVIGIIGTSLAGKPADRDHPYGHGKYETYASAAIGAMLVIAAWEVGGTAVERLLDGGAGPRVGIGSFAVMLGTLAVNIGVTTWERRVGKRLGSDVLVADAAHTSSDVFVSLGVIAGLVAVRLGFPKADAIIALGVAGAIAWTAWHVLRQASETLSDRARLSAAEVCAAASTVPGVLGCHSVRTRGLASEVYVDMHIQVDPGTSVEAGHDVAERVERAVSERFEQVADVIVHLEPLDEYQVRKTVSEIDSGLA